MGRQPGAGLPGVAPLPRRPGANPAALVAPPVARRRPRRSWPGPGGTGPAARPGCSRPRRPGGPVPGRPGRPPAAPSPARPGAPGRRCPVPRAAPAACPARPRPGGPPPGGPGQPGAPGPGRAAQPAGAPATRARPGRPPAQPVPAHRPPARRRRPGRPRRPRRCPARSRPRGPATCGRAWPRSPPAPSGPSVPGARLASRSRPPGPVPTPARGGLTEGGLARRVRGAQLPTTQPLSLRRSGAIEPNVTRPACRAPAAGYGHADRNAAGNGNGDAANGDGGPAKDVYSFLSSFTAGVQRGLDEARRDTRTPEDEQ